MKLPPTLGFRWELLEIALRPGLSFDELAALLQQHGSLNYNDVRGNETPFDLAARLFPDGRGPMLDLISSIAPAASFVPENFPASYNSEPSVARFLAEFVFRKKPAAVVEIGCFAGWASVHMAMALRACATGGRLFCIDYPPDCAALTRTNLDRHDVGDLATTIAGSSLDAAVLAQVPPALDLVFIDSSHQYPATLQEIEAYGARLSRADCLVLHDSISFAGVCRSIRKVEGRFRMHTFATEQGNGVTVLTPLSSIV